MGRISFILVIVVDVLGVLDVLKSNKEFEKKILWIAVILLLPFFGALGWFLLGKRMQNF